jgi:ABC-type phosphate transport system substrate-binding protein
MKASTLILATALGALTGSAAAAGYKIVANPSVPTSSLTRTALSRVFLKKSHNWPDGSPAVPVDLVIGSPTREAFSHDVHGRGSAAIDAYWQKQVFSGREVPPITKATDSEVIAYVRSTPGAIGYVSAGVPTAGVRSVDIQ